MPRRTTNSVGIVAAAGAPVRWLGRVLTDPPLRRGLLGGLALSALLMVLVFGGLLWGGFSAVDAVVSGDGFWATLAAAALKITAVALAVVISPVLYAFAAGVVTPGFLTAAHTRARELSGAAPYPERGLAGEATLVARGVGWQVRRLLRFLAFTLAFALLALVPAVGLLAVVGEALLAAHALAWELLTPHFEARGLGYADQKRFLRAHSGLTLGLGGAGLLLLLIPLAQPLALHASHAAAGALSARLDT